MLALPDKMSSRRAGIGISLRLVRIRSHPAGMPDRSHAFGVSTLSAEDQSSFGSNKCS
jgi:hypothetical protein